MPCEGSEFCKLQAAGLTPEERRVILSSTRGSLEFGQVTKALQTLWDEQFAGQCAQVHHSNFQETYAAEIDETDSWQRKMHSMPKIGALGMILIGTGPKTMWLNSLKNLLQLTQGILPSRKLNRLSACHSCFEERLGFGQHSSFPGQKGKACWICNGPHMAKDCPDRRHSSMMKGKFKGKQSYMLEYHDNVPHFHEDLYACRGNGKKGKNNHWLEAQTWMKGKGPRPSQQGKGQLLRPPVNSYHSEVFFGGLELLSSANEAQASSTECLPCTHGLLDSGATASAGPQIAVANLVAAVLSADRQAETEVRQSDRPYFRFGNGRCGRALYKAVISSKVSGIQRHFGLYAFPNPSELHRPDFDKLTFVPILIGMDHLYGPQSSMTVDFMTDMALDSSEEKPAIYQLKANRKGHDVLDTIYFLTRGCTSKGGHPRVHVVKHTPSAVTENKFIQFMPIEFDAMMIIVKIPMGDP